ncbi:MAG: peptidylprolyl isomerase [Bryobacterales bacterium]|nr:peptidylprolyl isomerase [Bryobacterales bacterium]
MRPLLRFLVFVLAALSLSAQNATPAEELEAEVVTSLGTFRFAFEPDKAPRHVEQFIRLAREGYYDGSAFFRVVLNGIIQGGDPLLKNPDAKRELWGTGGLRMLKSEISDLKHEQGTVSTVRVPNEPDSDGAQFFVCVFPQPPLDGQYSVFGKLSEGLDVVAKISQVPADANAITAEPVRIERVTIEPKRHAPFRDASTEQLKRLVTLNTTLGTMKLETMPDWAPEHVRQFLNLVAEGWYDHTGFHRIAKGFVAQGGMGYHREPRAAHPADRWVKTLKAEFRDDVRHQKGVVSMAHGDDPDSANTSFFLMLADAPTLDGNFSAFARVVEGMEVLDLFEQEEVDGETPLRRLEVVSATLEPK